MECQFCQFVFFTTSVSHLSSLTHTHTHTHTHIPHSFVQQLTYLCKWIPTFAVHFVRGLLHSSVAAPEKPNRLMLLNEVVGYF